MRKNGQIDNYEISLRMKNGTILRGLLSTRILRLDGKINFLSVIKDISEIKKAQDALIKISEDFKKNESALIINAALSFFAIMVKPSSKLPIKLDLGKMLRITPSCLLIESSSVLN